MKVAITVGLGIPWTARRFAFIVVASSAMPPLSTKLTNLIYRVSNARRRFAATYPGEEVLAAGATKALRSDRQRAVERGSAWVAARRSVALASSERLVCRDWDIPWSDVSTAELLHFRTLFGRGMVLRIATRDGSHYQFGLQHDDCWKSLPIELKEADAKLGYSLFSRVVRLVLLALIILLFLEHYLR